MKNTHTFNISHSYVDTIYELKFLTRVLFIGMVDFSIPSTWAFSEFTIFSSFFFHHLCGDTEKKMFDRSFLCSYYYVLETANFRSPIEFVKTTNILRIIQTYFCLTQKRTCSLNQFTRGRIIAKNKIRRWIVIESNTSLCFIII